MFCLFFFFRLFIWCIILMNFYILNYHCIFGIKPTSSWWIMFLVWSCISVHKRICSAILFLLVSLCALGIWVSEASWNEFGSFLYVYICGIFWGSIDISSSLKVWYNYVLKPSVPELFFCVGRLFNVSICLWVYRTV